MRPSRDFSMLAKGRRPGLEGYFKSRMEANVARHLDWLLHMGKITEWKYEPDTFWFESIRRGVRSYTPDFRIREGERTYYWEVKGYMDPRSATKIKRMRIYHPKVELHVIGRPEYAAIAKWSRLMPGWED